MFAKVKERLETTAAAATARPAPRNGQGDRPMPSIVGPDMRVIGNLETPGEIHVEGRIDGDVACSRLVVGPGGVIRGVVTATSVRVNGRVEGAIHGEEVFLLAGSHVTGDIVQSSLEIAPGASFEGAVRRQRAAQPRILPAPEAPLDLTTPVLDDSSVAAPHGNGAAGPAMPATKANGADQPPAGSEPLFTLPPTDSAAPAAAAPSAHTGNGGVDQGAEPGDAATPVVGVANDAQAGGDGEADAPKPTAVETRASGAKPGAQKSGVAA